MSINIRRYNIYTPSDRDPEDIMGYEVLPHKKGEFTTIDDLFNFALGFPKGDATRVKLLEALGEIDEQNY